MDELLKSTVFFRDTLVPFERASLSIASSPVLYGLSIYTVFGATWNDKKQKLYIFRLEDHYNRLVNSAKIMDFHSFVTEWPYERFKKTMLSLLKENKVKSDVLVRVTVFIDELAAGTKIHGLTNSLSAYVYPLGEILPLSGIHACISSWQRTADNAIPSRANGYDEAIALDQYGHVAEGTVANIFIVRDRRLITPDAATDILEGITRSSVLTLAKDLKIPCDIRSMDRSELYIADEVFMCGSSARITPILSIDKRPVGTGRPGSITKRLTKLYSQVQHGESKPYESWLLPV
jgi:branched-chain amino acid aminotransferase